MFFSPHDDEKRRKSIEEYYDQKISENYVFNFVDEIISYCRDDVSLLLQGLGNISSFTKKSYLSNIEN